MADRVWCRLTVGGSITAEQMEFLDDLVTQELSPSDAGQTGGGAHGRRLCPRAGYPAGMTAGAP